MSNTTETNTAATGMGEVRKARALIDHCIHGEVASDALTEAHDLLTTALAAQPAPVVGGSDWYAEQHARDSKELRKLCESRDFYKRRCDSLQALQPNMRDPERKAVCDILANGTTTALSTRPAESVAQGGEGVIPVADALGALECLNDYIRSKASVAPHYAYGTLRDFIKQQTPTPATGSGGEAVYQIRTGDGRGWIDETKAVYDWWNGSEDAPPRRILYTHPAPAGGDAGDSERLDYIERTFSGMTNRERYLPVQMIWGKGAMGRTLREACDKYMARDRDLTAKPGAEGV